MIEKVIRGRREDTRRGGGRRPNKINSG